MRINIHNLNGINKINGITTEHNEKIDCPIVINCGGPYSTQINTMAFKENNINEVSCLFINEWPLKKNLFGWHVILQKQGYQDPHIHPAGWLSGVIYLKVVPPLGNDEGAIEFGLSGERYSHVDSPKVIYQPKLGDIVFFPSSLHHY